MLVRLFGSNFRSLRANFELSLVAADLRREEDVGRGVVDVQIDGSPEPLRLLRTVALFGPNASGKSSVLFAAHAIRSIVTNSSPHAKPGSRIAPYEPFLLDDSSRGAPINLGCDVIFQHSILRYELSYTSTDIQTEKLTQLGNDDHLVLIDRMKSGEVRGKLVDESEANQLYVKDMQPNVAVLSKLAQHGPHKGTGSVQPYYRAIRQATLYKDYSDAAGIQAVIGRSQERFADDAEYRLWIMKHLIQAADVGICDVNVSREAIEIPEILREQFSKIDSSFNFPEKQIAVSFLHKGKSNQHIDFSEESSGTKKLYNIAADWWRISNQSVSLLADELGASLHPRLIDRLIQAVNSYSSGTFRSQLIFTTHETGLLESHDGQPPALRRDQVYFTKKNNFGESELFSLTEFKEDARHVHNIRKRYLSGLYGALPSLEKLSL